MDILLINGDAQPTPWGEYRYTSGLEEIAQRVILSAQIKKGSFIYNRNLGTDVSKLKVNDSKALKTAELLLKEAIMDSGCTLKINSLTDMKDGRYKAIAEVRNNSEKVIAEVIFVADL